MPVLIPEDPDPPPGARNLVRILTERLHAYGEALAIGDNVLARLTPRHWSGMARDAFTGTAVPRLDAQWQGIAAINRSATARVEGYSAFLHTLPELWLIYDYAPSERARLRGIWEEASRKLAGELMAWAAELDNLGHIDLPDPTAGPGYEDPAEQVEDLAEPVSHRTQAHPVGPVPQPGLRQALAMVAQAYAAADRVREQMLGGERRAHLPWPR